MHQPVEFTITGLSIAIALFIGTIELAGLLTHELGLHGSTVDWFQNFNLNTAGFIIVAMFIGTWIIALAIWHFARIEENGNAECNSPAWGRRCG